MGLVMATLWWAAVHAGPWEWFNQASYDWTHRLAAPFLEALSPKEVVIVYIDLQSHLELKQDPLKSWDRSLHARLVRRLTQAGARAVVFDVIFSKAGGDSAIDQGFAEAIREHGHVVLGGDLGLATHQVSDLVGTQSRTVDLPLEVFQKAAAGWGLVQLPIDHDYTVRRCFDGFLDQQQPSLARSTANVLGQTPPDNHSEQHWLRYYGPAMTLPSVSYHTALNPNDVPDHVFHNRVVFIGARPVVTTFQERRDEFRNPFPPNAKQEANMPGVEVHATQLLNLLRGETLTRLPPIFELALLLLTAVGFGAGLVQLRPVSATIVAFCSACVIMVAAVFWMLHQNHWFPWMQLVAFQIPTSLLLSVLSASTDWYQHRRRNAMFRRAAEQQLKQQAALLDKAQDAIVVLDFAGQTIYSNPSAARLYGWSLSELATQGLPNSALAASNADFQSARQSTMERGEWVGELEQLTRTGQRISVQSRWTLIRNDQGQPVSLLIINTDNTEKKRLEARYLQAQRMEAVGALAGGMAHDLNNALAPVMLGIDLLRRQPRDPDTEEMLVSMETNARRGSDMVRQVLLFARGEDGGRELVNVRQLIRETERMLRSTLPRSIRVSTLAPGDLWPVLANATRLHQVLLNLCLNARDAMPTGGTVTIAADNVELDAAEAAILRQAKPGSYVVVTVADTGIGIAPENLEKIFDPFFTTKAPGKGTGLGLATVAHIMESLHGFVDVQSQLGSGTTFEVYIPRADGASQTEFVRAPGDRRPCVLVIGDEHALRQLYATAMEAQGYRVVPAPDILESLNQLRRLGPANLAAVVIAVECSTSELDSLIQALSESKPAKPPRIIWVRDANTPNPGTAASHPFHSIALSKPVRLDELIAAVGVASETPPE